MLKLLIDIIHQIYDKRHQLVQIAIGKQKKTYKGSDLGILWAFVKPSMYIIAFYIAICIGFKASKDIEGIECPYFVWLMVGLVAWFYMRDMIIGGATCFLRNKPIIVKLGFPTAAIPAIPAISFLLVHFVLMIGVIVVSLILGARPSVYWLQLPFYTVLMVIFAIMWSFLAGCLSLLSKDFLNLLRSVSTMIFWLSGILFDPSSKGMGAAAWFFRFNPVTFIAEGYRNSFCRSIWFFEEPLKLGCFSITFIVVLALGLFFYKRIYKAIPDIV